MASKTSAVPRSASGTSPTTSPAAASRPADSDPAYVTPPTPRIVKSLITCGIDWAEAHHDVALVDENGKVVVFFKAASKFTTRYATLGFEEAAQLDEGDLWPTSYALISLTPETERVIAEQIRRAGGGGA